MSSDPLGMFEIMADNQDSLISFYGQLFGWKMKKDSTGFAYVHFSPPNHPVLGGIGQAQPGVPGWEKGAVFYIQVQSVTASLEKAVRLGGTQVVPRTEAPPYAFGMFRDPENNLIGIIEPFSS